MPAARDSANAFPLPGFGLLQQRGGPSPHQVHAGSTRLPVRWGRADRRKAAKLFHQARTWDRRSHEKGRHGGRLGHTGLQVLHCLIWDFLNWSTGQLDPSYEAIAAKANLARSTVATALQRLRKLGIITWLRRCVEEPDEDGRYLLRQISNAYAVLPPSQWHGAGLVPPPAPEPGTWGDHPPLPDQLAVAAAADSDVDRFRQLELDPSDRLALALARYGRQIERRDLPDFESSPEGPASGLKPSPS